MAIIMVTQPTEGLAVDSVSITRAEATRPASTPPCSLPVSRWTRRGRAGPPAIQAGAAPRRSCRRRRECRAACPRRRPAGQGMLQSLGVALSCSSLSPRVVARRCRRGLTTARRPGRGYRPLNTAGRFSRKAWTASLWSSVFRAWAWATWARSRLSSKSRSMLRCTRYFVRA